MRMGETLRYGTPKDPGPPTVDGLANFWHETVAPDGTRTQLEAGISPIGIVRAVDGPRTPAILIRGGPAGTATRPVHSCPKQAWRTWRPIHEGGAAVLVVFGRALFTLTGLAGV